MKLNFGIVFVASALALASVACSAASNDASSSTDGESDDALKSKLPVFDWAGLQRFETEDHTENTQALACTAGVCEII